MSARYEVTSYMKPIEMGTRTMLYNKRKILASLKYATYDDGIDMILPSNPSHGVSNIAPLETDPKCKQYISTIFPPTYNSDEESISSECAIMSINWDAPYTPASNNCET